MEKVVRVFASFDAADAADAAEDIAMSPSQRIDILLQLQERVYPDATEQGFTRVYRVTQFERS
jgi:hypothetical protein